MLGLRFGLFSSTCNAYAYNAYTTVHSFACTAVLVDFSIWVYRSPVRRLTYVVILTDSHFELTLHCRSLKSLQNAFQVLRFANIREFLKIVLKFVKCAFSNNGDNRGLCSLASIYPNDGCTGRRALALQRCP